MGSLARWISRSWAIKMHTIIGMRIGKAPRIIATALTWLLSVAGGFPALGQSAKDRGRPVHAKLNTQDRSGGDVSSAGSNIRRATYRALYSKPGLDRYAPMAVPSIHIIFANGNIKLEGAVATEGDKNLAGIVANGAAGAFSVANNLVVDK